MKFNEIKFGITKNLGNFEAERIDISASPETEGETPELILETLKALCYGTKLPSKVEAKESDVDPRQMSFDLDAKEEAAPVKPQKKAKKTGAGRPTQEEIAEKEVAKEEAKKERVAAEVAAYHEEAVEVVEEKVDEKPKKKLRVVGVVYNRDLDLHKKLVGEFLAKEFPKWKEDIAKSKTASVAMNGKEFLSDEGLMLESFKEQFRELMK